MTASLAALIALLSARADDSMSKRALYLQVGRVKRYPYDLFISK